jgi:hypothetical protein
MSIGDLSPGVWLQKRPLVFGNCKFAPVTGFDNIVALMGRLVQNTNGLGKKEMRMANSLLE